MLGIGRVLRRSGLATILRPSGRSNQKCDRLGDAVVILPLLLELQKHYQITVLTSERNDEFLRRFVPTKKYIAEPKSFHQVLRMLLSGCAVLGKRAQRIPTMTFTLTSTASRSLMFLKFGRMLFVHIMPVSIWVFGTGCWIIHIGIIRCFFPEPVLDSYAQLVCEALRSRNYISERGGHTLFSGGNAAR